VGRATGAIGTLAVVMSAATACSDSSPSAATRDERAACARIQAMYRDQNLFDEDELRVDLDAAVRHADRSGNEELQRQLEQVRDDYATLEAPEHSKVIDETITVQLRASAHLTLAVVECRERGIPINKA
jgi:hypothetical protein